MKKIRHILLATWICATLSGCSLVTGSRIECDPEDDYCPSGYHCDQGECVPGGGDGDADGDGDGDGDTDGDTPRHCGDRTCDLVENAETCPEDCPASCGDMLCSHQVFALMPRGEPR
jgi:hypothetical protein